MCFGTPRGVLELPGLAFGTPRVSLELPGFETDPHPKWYAPPPVWLFLRRDSLSKVLFQTPLPAQKKQQYTLAAKMLPQLLESATALWLLLRRDSLSKMLFQAPLPAQKKKHYTLAAKMLLSGSF